MKKATEQVFIVNDAPSQPSRSAQKLLDVQVSGSSQVNLENVEDFSHVCRICATITEFVMPIFSGEGLQNNLADKIHKHLPIQVCSTDALPLVVCYQCASTLLAWHELVQCCVQADTALRARLDAIQQKSKPPITQENPGTEDEAHSKLFYKNVKNALIEFDIDLDEGEPDMEFVCQKCSEKPALSTAYSLAQHMRYDHCTDAGGVQAFITNYVTFEQVLADDSDRDTQSDTKERSPVRLAQLRCPFCASVLSSATRLVHHLNRHVPVCLAAGVHCCGHGYTRPRALAQHLQDAHVCTDSPVAPLCCSCGYCAADADQLKQHYLTAHGDLNTKQKKTESPNNQKYIPAVCPECNKTFSNKYNMFAHLRAHAAPGTRHACPRCPRTYRQRGTLAQHVRLAHEGRLPHVCAHCGDAFPSRAQRDAHVRLHTGSAPYACAVCRKAFRAKNTLARHMEMHLGIRRYKCEICLKAFRKKSHLDYHIKTHMKGASGGRRACAYCGRWVAAAQYERHAVAAHAALLFHCAECGRCVPRRHFLPHMARHAVRYTAPREHATKHTDKPEQIAHSVAELIDATVQDIRQELTDNDISQENEFSDHSDMEYGFGPLPESVFEAIEDSQDSQLFEDETSHTHETEPITDESNKSLENNNENDNISINTSVLNRCIASVENVSINNDVLSDINANNSASPTDNNSDTDINTATEQTDHSKSDCTTEVNKKSHKKTRTCPICGKVYTASSSYFYHMKYFHKGSREHGCDVCGKRFGTKSCLTQHTAVHTGQYEFECKQCQKRFKSKASLYIHSQTHSGNKSWSCSQCGAAFRWRAQLSRHAARHAGTRAHACATCGRAFAVRCDLLRHARTHAAAALACRHCGQTFAQPRYLKVHMAKQHSHKLDNKPQ